MKGMTDARLKASSKRNLHSAPVAPLDANALRALRTPELVDLIALQPDRVAARLLRLPPRASHVDLDPAGSGGQFLVVVTGSIAHGERARGPLDIIFLSADEPAFRLQAQDDGAEVDPPAAARQGGGLRRAWMVQRGDRGGEIYDCFSPARRCAGRGVLVEHRGTGRDDDPRATGRGRREDRIARRRRRAPLAAAHRRSQHRVSQHVGRQARRRDRLEERARRRGRARAGPVRDGRAANDATGCRRSYRHRRSRGACRKSGRDLLRHECVRYGSGRVGRCPATTPWRRRSPASWR